MGCCEIRSIAEKGTEYLDCLVELAFGHSGTIEIQLIESIMDSKDSRNIIRKID